MTPDQIALATKIIIKEMDLYWDLAEGAGKLYPKEGRKWLLQTVRGTLRNYYKVKKLVQSACEHTAPIPLLHRGNTLVVRLSGPKFSHCVL